MQFTTLIAAAILSTTALAVPQPHIRQADAAPSATSAAPAAPAPTLSKTAQLTLADTAADRFTILNKNEDFVFDFNKPGRGLAGKGGDVLAANRKTFPALVGSGSGMALGLLGPCGFNTPHVHVRATELQVVTSGRVIVEMAPENGVFNVPGDNKSGRRVIKNTLTVNQMTSFYQGSVHSQYNPDCEPANFVASFNNEDFGTGQVADELFALGDETVAAVFGQAIDGADVDKFRKAIPASVAFGVEECLVKCGINKR